MMLPIFCMMSVFLSSSLIYGDEPSASPPETQKKIEESQPAEQLPNKDALPGVEKETDKQPPALTPSEEQILESVEKETDKQQLPAATEEQLLEKGAKEAPVAADKPEACASLSPEELAFANKLGPSHKTVFCSKFSSELRKITLNMVGQRDINGFIITPTHAVDMVATENDISIPFFEPDSAAEEPVSAPPPPEQEIK